MSPTTTGPAEDLVTDLLPIGRAPENPQWFPRVEEGGLVVRETGETVLRDWTTHDVRVLAFDRPNKVWTTILAPQTKAEVLLTDRRLITLWTRFRSDPSLGSVFERRVLMRVWEREEQHRLVLGGQLRGESTGTIFVAKPTGLFRRTSAVRFAFFRRRVFFAIELRGLAPEVATPLAAAAASAFSDTRLTAGADRLTEAQTDVLRSNLSRPSPPRENSWALYYDLPAPPLVD